MKPLIVAAVACLVVVSCSEHKTPYYARIAIAPDQRVELREGMPERPQGPHYQPFHGQNLISVEYWTGDKQRHDAIVLDLDHKLQSRTKHHLLRRGPFGSIYANHEYFYGEEHGHQPNQLTASSYSHAQGHDEPRIVGAPPEGSCRDLLGISIVRIFNHPPEYIVASTDYAPSGGMRALHVNGAKGGDWVHSNDVAKHANDGFEVATLLRDSPKTRAYFGLPQSLANAKDAAPPDFVWPETAVPSESDVMYFHYAGGCVAEWERQASGYRTRWLIFPTTPVDRALGKLDLRRGFAPPL